MPQASPELRERWQDDGTAIRYLRERGFDFSRGGEIYAPAAGITDENEYSAIKYLVLEWDYAFPKASV